MNFADRIQQRQALKQAEKEAKAAEAKAEKLRKQEMMRPIQQAVLEAHDEGLHLWGWAKGSGNALLPIAECTKVDGTPSRSVAEAGNAITPREALRRPTTKLKIVAYSSANGSYSSQFSVRVTTRREDDRLVFVKEGRYAGDRQKGEYESVEKVLELLADWLADCTKVWKDPNGEEDE